MNIYDLVKQNNQSNGQKMALSITSDQGETRIYTYAEMFTEIDLFAAVLSGQGLAAGDRIALVAENSPEWPIAFLAILKKRCTAVLLDASLLASDLAQQIERSDVRGVLTSPRIVKKLADVVSSGLPMLDIYRQCAPFRATAEEIRSPQTAADGDENVAAIIYSSGTTRTAAGIMHSHEALVASTMMCAASNKLTAQGKYLAVVPNSHIYGLICSILGPLLLCADVHFIESSTASAIVKAFAEYRPTIFPCVPKVFELFKTEIDKKVASNPQTKKLFDLFFPICLFLRRKTGLNLGKYLFKTIHEGFGGRIEIFCSAGAPMDKKTAEFYIGTGFNMLITYGATETNIPTLGNFGRKLTTDSCGQPYPDVSVKISESGELLIKSPHMMKGYFRDPELTRDAFEDGWFKTGDLCQVNAQGNYVIVGRCKENIVLATGKKVIPDDVEKAYAAIAGIHEMVVCGVPAPGKTYDEIHAFVVRQDASASTSPIIRDINLRCIGLPPHMKIVQVHFVDEIPRTSLQKPKRFLLKKIALAECSQLSENAPPVADPLRDAAFDAGQADNPESIEAAISQMIAEVGHFDRSIITSGTKPFSGLGLDSISSIELAMHMESRYGFRVDQAFTQNMTVTDMVNLILTPAAPPVLPDSSSLYPRKKELGDYRLYRHLCHLARFFYTIRVSNEKVIPDDSGFILCANHVSNFDYLWLTINFTRRRFEKFCCMAKQELLNNTRVSRIMSQVCGMIPVDRANVHFETMKCCQRQLKEQWGLLIHPEGTRSDTGELGEFKKGAAVLAIESNVPIIPAYIHGAFDVYPKGSKLPRLFDIRRMRRYAVEVVYGNPILPSDQTAEELMQRVKDAITALKNNLVGK